MVLEGSPEAVSSQSLDLRRSCPKGSRIFPSAGEGSLLSKEAVKYGELIVLGYNGSLASGDKGRRRSRIALFKRPKANGVKPDVIHHISTPLVSKALSNKGQHSISYTLSRSHSVIVEYTHDCDTDMFQIGRSTENMIDFVVTDTAPGGSCTSEGQSAQSTISRYACRIICERSPPYTARIYAAGFDSSRNIFLGERAAKWRTPDGLMDGLTTNGVLVMHPTGGFSEDSAPGIWREISVCGNVYALRDSRSAQQRGKLVCGAHVIPPGGPPFSALPLGLQPVPGKAGGWAPNTLLGALSTALLHRTGGSSCPGGRSHPAQGLQGSDCRSVGGCLHIKAISK
uniref:Pellino E3 ubiquitin protein ligase family member 3 n=1 Tax=Pelodiscus sinensis TaxID=13735 RepID=K7F574_PELSI